MGDSFKEVEAGLELAAKWLPGIMQNIFGLFALLHGKGIPPRQAAQMIADHNTVGKPNITEAGQ